MHEWHPENTLMQTRKRRDKYNFRLFAVLISSFFIEGPYDFSMFWCEGCKNKDIPANFFIVDFENDFTFYGSFGHSYDRYK